ncbi:MAG: LysR family transcriptional regulator [Xanthomonadales bacterium]|nr:LysR family transcriptional regulator [Xanthomonadales bacterium]
MSQFEEMENFVRVVEAGSISRAAEQQGVAKSGVSRRLADLEKRLGVRLLNRTTRRSSLTSAGRAFYEGAVRLVGDIAELNATTSGSQASLEGSLRVAAPLSFGLGHLSPAIDEFMRAYPALAVHIDFSDRHVDLVEQGVDLAVRIADLSDSSLKARKLCPIRLLLCASPDYLRRCGEPRCLADLDSHRILHYDQGGGRALRLEDARGRQHLVTAHPRLVANNGDFLRDMAVAGHGIVLAPSFIAWRALAAGDLVPLLPDYWPRPLSAWAVYPQTRYLSRRARVFIDFLAARFGGNPYWDEFSGPKASSASP